MYILMSVAQNPSCIISFHSMTKLKDLKEKKRGKTPSGDASAHLTNMDLVSPEIDSMLRANTTEREWMEVRNKIFYSLHVCSYTCVVSSNNHHNLGFGPTLPSTQQELSGLCACSHRPQVWLVWDGGLLALQITDDRLSCCGLCGLL